MPIRRSSRLGLLSGATNGMRRRRPDLLHESPWTHASSSTSNSLAIELRAALIGLNPPLLIKMFGSGDYDRSSPRIHGIEPGSHGRPRPIGSHPTWIAKLTTGIGMRCSHPLPTPPQGRWKSAWRTLDDYTSCWTL